MSQRKSRIAMVDNQIRPADVTNYALLGAFLKTPREQFVPQDQITLAYAEHEIALSAERKMMTPRTFAKLVDTVAPKPTDEVLLIGAGFGYEAAILAKVSQTVIAVEGDKKLAKAAEEKLTAQSVDNAIIVSGKLKKGGSDSAPYDVIIFNGAVQEIPDAILAQLKPNGRLIAVVEDNHVHTAYLINASHGHFAKKCVFNASAPLLNQFNKKEEFDFV